MWVWGSSGSYLGQANSLKAGGWIESPNLEAGYDAEVAGYGYRRPAQGLRGQQAQAGRRIQRWRTCERPERGVSYGGKAYSTYSSRQGFGSASAM